MARTYDTNTTADELVRGFANEIKSKIILTTGVTPGGLGTAFLEAIVNAQPGMLILVGRNVQKIQKTADAISAAHPNVKFRVLKLDLSSLAAYVLHIDVVVNNSGLMGAPFILTADGFENQFGTNHLGHFLFTNSITGKILVSKSLRVVNITSDGHSLNPIRWADYNFTVCLLRTGIDIQVYHK